MAYKQTNQIHTYLHGDKSPFIVTIHKCIHVYCTNDNFTSSGYCTYCRTKKKLQVILCVVCLSIRNEMASLFTIFRAWMQKVNTLIQTQIWKFYVYCFIHRHRTETRKRKGKSSVFIVWPQSDFPLIRMFFIPKIVVPNFMKFIFL